MPRIATTFVMSTPLVVRTTTMRLTRLASPQILENVI